MKVEMVVAKDGTDSLKYHDQYLRGWYAYNFYYSDVFTNDYSKNQILYF